MNERTRSGATAPTIIPAGFYDPTPSGTPIGAPLIGALTSQFGPRIGMAVCGAVPVLAAVVVAAAMGRRARRQAPGSFGS